MPVRGQLWYLTQGVDGDTRLVFINSDGTNATIQADNDPTMDLGTNFPEDVVLDTAAGLYFVLSGDGAGTNSSILVGHIGSAAPPVAVEVYDPFGEAAFALHLDSLNNKLYVSFIDFNNFGDTTQGIKVYDYDPVTGALSNEQFLFTQATAGIDPSAPDGFGLFIPRDYDFDFQRGYVYFAQHTLGDFTESNMVWRLDLNNPNDPAVPLVPQAQFPLDGDGVDFTTLNGIIIDVEVDVDSDRVFFTTHAEDTGDPVGEDAIWLVANASTADGTANAVKLTLVGVNLNDFYPGDLAYDEVHNVLYVESEHVTDGTSPDDDVILVFQLDAAGTTATLVDTITPGFGGIANVAGMQFNSLPVLDVTGTASAATEQGAAIALLSGTPSLTDVDSGHLASATVQITGGTFAGSDTVDNLGVGPGLQQAGLVAGTSITVSWNQLTSTLTLTGYDTIANYQAVLALVSYQATGDDPDNDGANPTRTVTWTVSDGALGIPGGEQNSDTTTLAITAVNDDPVNTTGGAVATSEDAASAAVTGLSVSDVDSGNLSVTLAVGRGTVTVSTVVPGGVTAGQVTGNGTGSVTLTGSQAELNATLAALGGVSYTPTPNINGPDTLTMTTSDGSGNDVDNVSISVAAVNDAPTVAGDGTESAAPIVEDTPSPTGQTVSDLFAGQYSDALDQVAGGSSADAFAGVAVTANGSNGAQGQWQYFNGAIWVNIGAASDGAAVLLAASTFIRFNPALGFSGAAPTLVTHLVDASAGAIVSGALADLTVTGGTTPYSSGTVTLDQTVTNQNDAPTGVTGTLQAPEDANNGSAAGTLVAQDPDSSGPFTFTLLNDAGGRFAMDANGNVTVADGLLLDYEQQNSHTIRVRVTDEQGASSEFDVNVSVIDVLGEDVTGDARHNMFWGGAEADTLRGMDGSDTLKGGGGTDTLLGGNGVDWLDGGAGADVLTGGDGNDVFVFRKGEANGDTIMDFFGRGNALGDSIVLVGYGAGTTFTRVGPGSSNTYQINDNGVIETLTIYATGQVHSGDYEIVTTYDWAFGW